MYLNADPPVMFAACIALFSIFVYFAGGGLNEILPLVCFIVFLFAISFIIQCYYAIANGDRSIFEK